MYKTCFIRQLMFTHIIFPFFAGYQVPFHPVPPCGGHRPLPWRNFGVPRGWGPGGAHFPLHIGGPVLQAQGTLSSWVKRDNRGKTLYRMKKIRNTFTFLDRILLPF